MPANLGLSHHHNERNRDSKIDFSFLDAIADLQQATILATLRSMQWLWIVLGVLSAAMGIKGFLVSSHFIDGGITGVAMLLGDVTGVATAWWIGILNLPFVVLAYKTLGRPFALRTLANIIGLAMTLAWVPFPDVTPDLFLTAAFGGLFIGLGIGLSIRGGAVLDGSEIAALLLSRKYSELKIGDIILAFNCVLFLCAIALLGVEPALYSMVTYFAASKTLNFVVYGTEGLVTLTIISHESDAIRQAITHSLGRGVTGLKGYGGRDGHARDVLMCVVSRLEIGRIKEIVRSKDPHAFLTIHALTQAEGGVLRPTQSILH